ncbi:MAG: hypothetical protein ABL921_20120 [Pirellula sp.]
MIELRVIVIQAIAMFALPSLPAVGQEPKQKTLAHTYLESSKEPFPYVCAIFGERTQVHVDATKSNFLEAWYLHSYSPKLDIHRHDQMYQSQTTSAGYSPMSMIEETLFLRKGKEFKQYMGASVRQPPEKANPTDPQSGVWRQTYFEPTAVPMIGFGCFNQRSIEFIGGLDKLINPYKLIEKDTSNSLCVQRYSISRTQPIFDLITFDERLAGMPIEVRRCEVQNGKEVLCERITTKWAKIGERWLPILTEAEPQIRSLTMQWKVRYHWMLNDIPDAVFDMDAVRLLRAKQLKDLAVQQWNDQMAKK